MSADVLFRVGEYLDVVQREGERRFACAKCEHDLGPVSENYKRHTLMRVASLQEAGPLVGDPQRFIDDQMELRQYFCPGCVTLLDNEINRAGAELLFDIELR